MEARHIHQVTDCEFDLLDEGRQASLTFRTGEGVDHSFLLPRDIAERLAVEIAHKLRDETPPTGSQ